MGDYTGFLQERIPSEDRQTTVREDDEILDTLVHRDTCFTQEHKNWKEHESDIDYFEQYDDPIYRVSTRGLNEIRKEDFG